MATDPQPPGDAADIVEGFLAEQMRLHNIEREYSMLTRVVSVLVERLLDLTGGRAVEITDQAIEEARGTKAWRDASRDVVMITVA